VLALLGPVGRERARDAQADQRLAQRGQLRGLPERGARHGGRGRGARVRGRRRAAQRLGERGRRVGHARVQHRARRAGRAQQPRERLWRTNGKIL